MKIFLDTNILAYALDPGAPAKRKRAREILRRTEQFVVSTQVCQELFVTAVAKCGVEPLRAKQVVKDLEYMEIVQVTPTLIHQAIDLKILNQISFWDALVVAAASAAKCTVLWTEDLNPAQVIAGVRIENPLATAGPAASGSA